MFKIIKKDENSNARLGVLSTPHGQVKTPSYVIVATHAQIKRLKPSDIKKTKTQMVICNTFHLWDYALKVKNTKSVIRNPLIGKLGTNLPTMTDSGGFQVFSLGFGKNRIGKILNPVDKRLERLAMSFIHRRKNIKIGPNGVYFKMNDGHERFLGPELSIKIQKQLGADIIFAFDECTSPLDNFTYNKKALKRTHKWAKISLKCKVKSEKLNGKRQMLFGIVQGGRFKSLRVKSAKFIGSQSFDGFGIGGSFGKDEMIKTLKWVVPHLPEQKPRHLLGIGKIEDIFNAIEQGIDLFDCVIPTREARHGRIYTKHGYYDTSKYHSENALLERGCECPTCKTGITRGKLRAMFRDSTKEKQKAQRWATIHNVWFFNNLLESIRNSIAKNMFKEFKKKFLKTYTS